MSKERIIEGSREETSVKEQEELNAYRKEIEQLRVYKEEYERYVAEGGFDYVHERVLHLIKNPISEKNEGRKLPQANASSPSVEGSNQQEHGSASNTKDEIDTLKKRIERMKEVFASQTNRFRDAVYQLTGWNVDLSLHENKVRLRSRYAASRDDCVELLWYVPFCWMRVRNGADKFELLDTAFVNSLDSHLFAAITVSNSFPVFLGAVTQDLFEKQTMYPGPS